MDSILKQQLRTDLTASMKARDTLTTGTLRMAITAVTNEEVAGKEAKDLSDADVLRVLQREVKKRTESAEVYAGAGRPELAEQERAEIGVLTRYLPQPLTGDELAAVIAEAVAEVQGDAAERPTMKQMGLVIKAANARAVGRADGGAVAAAVKAALA
ncbi:GatB/YqeY domain-containing protein [Nakamurella sp. A5-74]|uniref:GatB/YqeY domain-containing protein n=1 Tax=Nakamurella sp. A5-74 TaxID=3158264 RepID=A0AAU8DL47_9ACTN